MLEKRLIIFEFLDEVAAYQNSGGRQALKQDGTDILALRPEVQAYLARAGISFLTSSRFFDRKSHETLLLKSDEIVQEFRKNISISDDMGIREGYNNTFLFYIRCFVHYMLFHIEVIDRSVEALGINHIAASDYTTPYRLEPLVDSGYGYLGQISGLLSRYRGIGFESIDMSGQKNRKSRFFDRVYEYFAAVTKELVFALACISVVRSSRGRTVVLSSSKDYNIASVMQDLHDIDDNIFICYLTTRDKWGDFKKTRSLDWIGNLYALSGRVPARRKALFAKKIAENEGRLKKLTVEKPDLLKYRNIDFSSQMLERIRLGLFPRLVDLYGQTIHLRRLLSGLRSDMILAPHSREITYNLGELARRYNIPAMLISHGSHVPPRNRYEKIEWSEHGLGLMDTDYDYVAVQTPWAEAYLQEMGTRSETIRTGPLLFGKKVERKETREQLRARYIPGHEDDFIILNASTPKTREVIRFYIYETVDEYISNTNDVIKATQKLENVYLIVRFRPLPDLTEEDFAKLLIPSDCYGIYSQGSFTDYLLFSDLLVSYSSTAIEEALQNELPVLQYDPQGKYCHVPATHLEPEKEIKLDSCYFSGSERYLAWALDWIVKHHKIGQVPPSIFDRHRFSPGDVEPLRDIYNRFKNHS